MTIEDTIGDFLFAIANIDNEKLKGFVKASPIARGILENNILQNEDETLRALKNMAVSYKYEHVCICFLHNHSELLHLFRRRSDQNNFIGIDSANYIEIDQKSDF